MTTTPRTPYDDAIANYNHLTDSPRARADNRFRREGYLAAVARYAPLLEAAKEALTALQVSIEESNAGTTQQTQTRVSAKRHLRFAIDWVEEKRFTPYRDEKAKGNPAPTP